MRKFFWFPKTLATWPRNTGQTANRRLAIKRKIWHPPSRRHPSNLGPSSSTSSESVTLWTTSASRFCIQRWRSQKRGSTSRWFSWKWTLFISAIDTRTFPDLIQPLSMRKFFWFPKTLATWPRNTGQTANRRLAIKRKIWHPPSRRHPSNLGPSSSTSSESVTLWTTSASRFCIQRWRSQKRGSTSRWFSWKWTLFISTIDTHTPPSYPQP